MIPHTKHVFIAILVGIALLCGLLYARTAGGIHEPTVVGQQGAVVVEGATERRVHSNSETPRSDARVFLKNKIGE